MFFNKIFLVVYLLFMLIMDACFHRQLKKKIFRMQKKLLDLNLQKRKEIR